MGGSNFLLGEILDSYVKRAVTMNSRRTNLSRRLSVGWLLIRRRDNIRTDPSYTIHVLVTPRLTVIYATLKEYP